MTDFHIEPATQVPESDTPRPSDSDFEFRKPDHKASRPKSLKDMIADRRSRGGDGETGSPQSPRERRTTSGAGKKATPAMPRNLGKQVAELYGLAGMMLMPFDQPCATAVMESA